MIVVPEERPVCLKNTQTAQGSGGRDVRSGAILHHESCVKKGHAGGGDQH